MAELWRPWLVLFSLPHLQQCSRDFYLLDSALSNDTYPSLDQDLFVDSIQEAWDTILSSLIPSNDSLTFNLCILSDLHINQSSEIDIPWTRASSPITLNIECLLRTPCVLHLHANSTLLSLYDAAHNSTKLILSLSNLDVNIADTSGRAGMFLDVFDVQHLDVLLDAVRIFALDGFFAHRPIWIEYAYPALSNTFSASSLHLYDVDFPLHLVNGGRVLIDDLLVTGCTSANHSAYHGMLFFEHIVTYRFNDVRIRDNYHIWHEMLYIKMSFANDTGNASLTHVLSNAQLSNNYGSWSALFIEGVDDYNAVHYLSNISIDGFYGAGQYGALSVYYAAYVYLYDTDVATFSYDNGADIQEVFATEVRRCSFSDAYYGLSVSGGTYFDVYDSSFVRNEDCGLYLNVPVYSVVDNCRCVCHAAHD